MMPYSMKLIASPKADEVALACIQGAIEKIDKFDKGVMEQIAAAGDFLPRVNLFVATSEFVMDGKIPANHYGLVEFGGDPIDLGTEVDVLCITWRPMALQYDEKSSVRVYDVNDPKFKEIQAMRGTLGFQAGPEYLIWVGSQQKFATFLMGSKSACIEAKNMNARLHNLATLKTHMITSKAGKKYFTPLITACTTPIPMPNADDMMKVIEKFQNPPKSEVQKADQPAEEATRER